MTHTTELEATPEPGFPVLPQKLYDSLKYIALVVLPALGALYAAVGGIWGLPAVVEVVGTIAAIDTFLGLLIRASSTAYLKTALPYDGTIDVATSPEGTTTFMLNLDGDPMDLNTMQKVTFKINASAP